MTVPEFTNWCKYYSPWKLWGCPWKVLEFDLALPVWTLWQLSPVNRSPVINQMIRPICGSHAVGTEFTAITNQIWVLNIHLWMNLRTHLIPQEEYYYPWSRTSNMSNPSIVIEPPGINWRWDNRQTSQSGHVSRRDLFKRKHISWKCRMHINYRLPLSPLLVSNDNSSKAIKAICPELGKNVAWLGAFKNS